MAYTIKKFIEQTGQIIVKFDSGPSTFSVDLPLSSEGLYVTGEELDSYISGFEPKEFNERAAKILAGIANASEIAALVDDSEVEPEVPQQTAEELAAQIAAAEEQKAAELDKYIKAALIKYNLLSV